MTPRTNFLGKEMHILLIMDTHTLPPDTHAHSNLELNSCFLLLLFSQSNTDTYVSPQMPVLSVLYQHHYKVLGGWLKPFLCTTAPETTIWDSLSGNFLFQAWNWQTRSALTQVYNFRKEKIHETLHFNYSMYFTKHRTGCDHLLAALFCKDARIDHPSDGCDESYFMSTELYSSTKIMQVKPPKFTQQFSTKLIETHLEYARLHCNVSVKIKIGKILKKNPT